MIEGDPALTGTWEKPGKSLIAAAFSLVLIAGSLYFAAGSIVMLPVTLVMLARDTSWAAGGGFLEIIERYYSRLQVPILTVSSLAQFVILLALTLFLVRRWHTRRIGAYFGYRAPPAVDLALAAAGAIAMVPLAGLLSAWYYHFFPVLRQISRASSLLLSARSPGQAALVVFTIAVTPAICEEALFRGYFLRTLSRRMGPMAAITLSGVVFALYHRSPLGLLSLVLAGVYLGFVYQRTRSLYVSMACHFLYNLTIIALTNLRGSAFLLAEDVDRKSLLVAAAATVVLAAGVVLIAVRGAARGRGAMRRATDRGPNISS